MSLIYEGFENEVLENVINNSSEKRLIQELNFKYGLKVVDRTVSTNTYQPSTFLLADPSGFMVGRVWTDKEGEDLIYNYRTPYYRKDRGSDSADRETIHSKKLSTLMATLKRNNVIPPSSGIVNKVCKDVFNNGINQMESSFGSSYKQANFNAEILQDMMRAIVLGESPNENTLTQCKETLDKWNEKDKIQSEKVENVRRFFGNEFYAIGADKLNHLVIGSVKTMPRQGTSDYSFEVVKPFKRMVEMPEELKAITLMNKVHAEGNNVTKFYSNIVPAISGYIPDLDVVNVSIRHVDEFNCHWTFVPCSGL